MLKTITSQAPVFEKIEAVVPASEGWSFPTESFDISTKLSTKGGLPENVKRFLEEVF